MQFSNAICKYFVDMFTFLHPRGRVLTPFSRIFEFFLNDECGNEAHGVRHRVSVTKKQTKEMWMEYGVVLSL